MAGVVSGGSVQTESRNGRCYESYRQEPLHVDRRMYPAGRSCCVRLEEHAVRTCFYAFAAADASVRILEYYVSVPQKTSLSDYFLWAILYTSPTRRALVWIHADVRCCCSFYFHSRYFLLQS